MKTTELTKQKPHTVHVRYSSVWGLRGLVAFLLLLCIMGIVLLILLPASKVFEQYFSRTTATILSFILFVIIDLVCVFFFGEIFYRIFGKEVTLIEKDTRQFQLIISDVAYVYNKSDIQHVRFWYKRDKYGTRTAHLLIRTSDKTHRFATETESDQLKEWAALLQEWAC